MYMNEPIKIKCKIVCLEDRIVQGCFIYSKQAKGTNLKQEKATINYGYGM